jgi:hypothetical protein
MTAEQKKLLIRDCQRMLNNYEILAKGGPENRKQFFMERIRFYTEQLKNLDPETFRGYNGS